MHNTLYTIIIRLVDLLVTHHSALPWPLPQQQHDFPSHLLQQTGTLHTMAIRVMQTMIIPLFSCTLKYRLAWSTVIFCHTVPLRIAPSKSNTTRLFSLLAYFSWFSFVFISFNSRFFIELFKKEFIWWIVVAVCLELFVITFCTDISSSASLTGIWPKSLT